MSDALALDSPAKLNLVLQVTGRRADGYHLLDTVFQFIDLCDRVELRVTGDGAIERAGGDSPVPAADDLALAAARLLRRRPPGAQGARIAIDKRIPIGGGLGGGSSDAATCLLGLNRLWGLGLGADELAALGLELGADVPVFVRGRAAFARGVGERLEALALEQPHYLVVDPGVAVSTARVFADRQLTRDCDPLTIRAFLRGAGVNVCEPVVRRLYPAVGAALDWLGEHAAARLSGTGGCVFARFDSLESAEMVASRVPGPWVAHLARGLNRSPLHRQLGLPD